MAPRTYELRTYGCQMNVHDSERLAGLLEAAGYVARRRTPTPTSWCSTPAPSGRTPTTSCTATSAISPRESTATQACRSPSAAAWRRRTATRCCGGRRGSTSCSARTTSVRCRCCSSVPGTTDAQVEIAEALRGIPVGVACRPRIRIRRLGFHLGRLQQQLHVLHRALAARQGSRPQPGDIQAEISSLVDQGVLEVTLLGQNVNCYGVAFADPDAARPRSLRHAAAGMWTHRGSGAGSVHLAAPRGVHRRRHRRDGRDAERVPSLHMPLQSGSDRYCAPCAGHTGRSATSGSSTGCAP